VAEYHSSASAFEKFLRSNIWRDMQYELNAWLNDIHLKMEDPEGEKHMYKFIGNAETIRNVLAMPGEIKDNIIDDSQESED
jgi:hypothetical protein